MFPTRDRLVERVDELDEAVLEAQGQWVVDGIVTLRRSTLRLRRAMEPQRDVLTELCEGQFRLIDQDIMPYFRDTLEGVMCILGANEILRDRTETLLATNLSVMSHRQNETMRTLSVVATIFCL